MNGSEVRRFNPRKPSHNGGVRSPAGGWMDIQPPGRLLGLAEPEREAVAFANREVLVAVDVAAAQRRRQRPDAVRVNRRVLRIGVDLALANQLEPGLLRELDRIV